MNPSIRTDLAIENAEMFQGAEELQGVSITEENGRTSGIRVVHVQIENEKGAEKMGKAMGDYITLEVPELDQTDVSYHREITEEVAEQLRNLMPDIKNKKILVAGVGNQDMAPDALGPMTIEHLFITRHLIQEYGRNSEITRGMGCVSALAPGVMAQTGIETREILLGAVRETKPEVLIVIDALAARSVKRLNKTIQITNTGIAPGAGVGNRRFGIDEESMGIPVIAIGIPTVIDAATIVNDAVGNLLAIMEETKNRLSDRIWEGVAPFDEQERYQLMRELMSPEMINMFVTPKNIDEIVIQMSYTLSESINGLCHSLS
ncbi:MAG: GPR endopeptidase [Clostridia bacterium]|nr:GPR endopeptidase [Lachnospiraceae bacterium]NCC00133.1 GPR endopeptidase [Clostridia bacterium]NCD01605.1 GPR endopeptidase [Clostridia bacterium]